MHSPVVLMWSSAGGQADGVPSSLSGRRLKVKGNLIAFLAVSFMLPEVTRAKPPLDFEDY